MVLHGFWQVFFGGLLGPFLLELLKVAALRNRKKKDKTELGYCDPVYWVATAALFIVSGLVATFNGVEHVTLQQAAQLGINAPAIVAAYATTAQGKRKVARAAIGERAAPSVRPGVAERVTAAFSWL
jgi:drug/metabolite transporter (DMT)-like permease